MRIEAVRVTAFRNIRDQILDFTSHDRVVFHGGNGQGKTSFLEALYYLLRLESFRGAPRGTLVTANESFAALQGRVAREGMRFRLSVRVDAGGTTALIDRLRVARFSDYRSQFPVVYFCPRALSLIEGSPAERRRYFDRLFSSADSGYAEALAKYHRILEHRRAAFPQRNPKLLRVLYSAFRAQSEVLWRARRACYFRLQSFWEDPFGKSLGVRWNAGQFPEDESGIEKAFLEGATLTSGPHRDVWRFLCGNRDLRYFGSRGEQRMALIAMKQAETRYIEACIGTEAVQILDDPLAELDTVAQSFVRALWTGRQCFIATTRAEAVGEDAPCLLLRTERGAVRLS
jgi:DNA replication and repair protein RecF